MCTIRWCNMHIRISNGFQTGAIQSLLKVKFWRFYWTSKQFPKILENSGKFLFHVYYTKNFCLVQVVTEICEFLHNLVWINQIWDFSGILNWPNFIELQHKIFNSDNKKSQKESWRSGVPLQLSYRARVKQSSRFWIEIRWIANLESVWGIFRGSSRILKIVEKYPKFPSSKVLC